MIRVLLKNVIRRLALRVVERTRPAPGSIRNRADLLLDPMPDDTCTAFEPGRPGRGSCDTDGHYLCVECENMNAAAWGHRHGLEYSEVR